VDATVRIESIDTGNEKRDDHLRSPDFFDAPNHPEMRFTSTEITNVNGNTFQMKGDLTIRGTTKPVVFETELLGTAVDNEGRQRAGFTAATTINRKDFGLTWNRVTEAGGLVVGEDVDITLDIQTIRGDA
jgi:polyisoprenoid-binding protein YceI